MIRSRDYWNLKIEENVRKPGLQCIDANNEATGLESLRGALRRSNQKVGERFRRGEYLWADRLKLIYAAA